MKVLSLTHLLIISLTINLYGQNRCSLEYIKGRWVEQQAEYMQIEWHFHSEDNFSMISYYGGELSTYLSGYIFSGKYKLDTLNDVIIETNYKLLTLPSGNVSTIDSNKSITWWKILDRKNEELRLMEIQYYEQAIKQGPIDYSKWNTRLLIRPKNLVYSHKEN